MCFWQDQSLEFGIGCLGMFFLYLPCTRSPVIRHSVSLFYKDGKAANFDTIFCHAGENRKSGRVMRIGVNGGGASKMTSKRRWLKHPSVGLGGTSAMRCLNSISKEYWAQLMMLLRNASAIMLVGLSWSQEARKTSVCLMVFEDERQLGPQTWGSLSLLLPFRADLHWTTRF